MIRLLLASPAVITIPVVASADDAANKPQVARQETAPVEQHFRQFAVTTDLQRLLTRDDADAYLVIDAASVLKNGKVAPDSPLWQSLRESLRADHRTAPDEKLIICQCYFQHGDDRDHASRTILETLGELIIEAGAGGISQGTHFGDDPWADWIDAASPIDQTDTDEPAIGEDNVKVCPANSVLARLLLGPNDAPDCYVSIDLRERENATGIPPAALDDIVQLVPQLTLKRKREICFHINGIVYEFENERSSLEKLGIPAALPHDLGFETWSIRRTLGGFSR